MDTIGEAQANYLRAKLQAFLSLNPEAEVRSGEPEPSVFRPWGEEAIEIPLHSDDEELCNALNTVRLPPRFTAIWHDDTKDLEVIFTVLEKENRLLRRSFDFHYKGICHHCSFGPSSARLRAIARKARPSGSPSSSNYRNLLPFYRFEHSLEARPNADYVTNGEPISFWIRGLERYDNDHIRDLVRNLNFHMSYFDRHTPTIYIHEEPPEPDSVRNLNPPPTDQFPGNLSARDIDQHLLILWESAQKGDPFLRFIHYYQILEYAGFYHFRDRVRSDIERAIIAPDAVSRPVGSPNSSLNISTDRKATRKDHEMVGECVDLHEMWERMTVP